MKERARFIYHVFSITFLELRVMSISRAPSYLISFWHGFFFVICKLSRSPFFFATDLWRSNTCQYKSYDSWFIIWAKISRTSQPAWWYSADFAWNKWNIQVLHKGLNFDHSLDWPKIYGNISQPFQESHIWQRTVCPATVLQLDYANWWSVFSTLNW